MIAASQDGLQEGGDAVLIIACRYIVSGAFDQFICPGHGHAQAGSLQHFQVIVVVPGGDDVLLFDAQGGAQIPQGPALETPA